MSLTWWPRCRHADPKHDPTICVLPPGVLTCPCLGARGPGQQVAELAVDDEGQLVWSALGSNNQPVAYHTFVAMRRDAGGQLRPVVLKAGQKPQLNTQGGVGFFALLDAQDNGGNVTVDELMTRALAGEEFVLLH